MTARRPVTLLIANSIDFVADLLVARLGSDKVFRYNTDLWRDYTICVTGSRIEISDPIGRSVTEADIAKVFRRSSMRASTLFPGDGQTELQRYAEEEVWVVLGELLNIFWEQGKVVLSQPLATLRSGKLQQLRVAAKYFPVTPHRFLFNRPDLLRAGQSSVAKSFNFKYADGIGFYSTRVNEDDLDSSEPWFLTDFVDATHDVTVAVIRDDLFAFDLDRTPFLGRTIDWRQAPMEYAHRGWRRSELPGALRTGIFEFMREVGQHFARIDFLRSGERYVFLEANYNGEWGWLDPDATEGLMTKIVREIDPMTPCVSCPRPRWQ
jgi:hypothetical protein